MDVGELRDVRAGDAIRSFEKLGGIRRRGKGDHVNLKVPSGVIVTFSGVREPVKIGLLKAMLRRAEISEQEFLAALGRKK